jgi:integrase
VLCSGKTSNKTYVAQRDLPSGRTRRVTVAGVNEIDLETARRLAADMLVEMRRGIDPKAKKETLTLRTALDAYRAANAHRLRPRSEESYRSTVARYLHDWLDRPITELTREMVETRHQRIAEDIEVRQRKSALESAKRLEAKAVKAEHMGWNDAAARYRDRAAKVAQRSPVKGHATANGVMRALRLLWNFAADKNPALGPNPVRLRKQWFVVPRRERVVRADDLPRFYEGLMNLENSVQRDYLRLLLFTGLRRREAAGLRWSDVDLKGRILRIPAAATKAKRKLDLPLSDVILDMLVARRSIGDTTFVFPANSKSGHLAEPKFALEQIARATGIRISAHDLRRTFVTVAESCDISPLALKMLVNHSVGRDVTSGYVIMNTERLREATQKVADRLKSLCGIIDPVGPNVAKLKVRKRPTLRRNSIAAFEG